MDAPADGLLVLYILRQIYYRLPKSLKTYLRETPNISYVLIFDSQCQDVSTANWPLPDALYLRSKLPVTPFVRRSATPLISNPVQKDNSKSLHKRQ